ncbi:Septum site-determining protein MinC [Buchnera aphidicola (Tetraneura ulmi)]|uniref:septum site-determining protein MinC n=1 Tax=Buchnera aphidicola TaxID=9 RepID=UPI00346439EC
MKNIPIKIQGNVFTFMVLYLLNDNIEIVKNALQKKIKLFPSFFKEAPIAINISNLSRKVNLKEMIKEIVSSNLNVIGFTGCKDLFLKKIIKKLGYPIFSDKNKIFYDNQLSSPKIFSSKLVKLKKNYIIDTPVRSGQTIYARSADLIVTNNVNPGAELIADGNVHIYGFMKGRVLAGANGNRNSQIFCTKLFSELVSISGEYVLLDEIKKKILGKTVRIFLKNDKLKINLLD